jgi:hypothetical protein
MTGESRHTQHTEFAVKDDTNGRILFRSKPWDFDAAAAFAAQFGGTVITRDVERSETATEWREVSPEVGQ